MHRKGQKWKKWKDRDPDTWETAITTKARDKSKDHSRRPFSEGVLKNGGLSPLTANPLPIDFSSFWFFQFSLLRQVKTKRRTKKKKNLKRFDPRQAISAMSVSSSNRFFLDF